MLTVSFLVDSMKKLRGGVAGNIAYTLGLLGERPLVVSAAGQDFAEYRKFMESSGIDAAGIKEVPNEFTASCFINTDMVNNQIVAFYPGAIGHSKEISLQSMGLKKDDWVIISPTDPESMAKHTNECKQVAPSTSSIRASRCRGSTRSRSSTGSTARPCWWATTTSSG